MAPLNSGIKRRHFLKALGVAAVAVALPAVAAPAPHALQFHPGVFEAISGLEGVSVRFIRSYRAETDRNPCRLDILYGWATVRPELVCRVNA
ncbi:MAG: twin-arginine translocation signal domain-containing protein [Thermoplasmatota archaeon]